MCIFLHSKHMRKSSGKYFVCFNITYIKIILFNMPNIKSQKVEIINLLV